MENNNNNNNNNKVRQSLNTKAGKITKISKGQSVKIVLERCDARKGLIKTVSKFRAVKIALERCDNLIKQYAHQQKKRQVAKIDKRYHREVSIVLQRCDTQEYETAKTWHSGGIIQLQVSKS